MSRLNVLYAQKVKNGELKPDKAQEQIADRLDHLCVELSDYVPEQTNVGGLLNSFKKLWKKPIVKPKGIYLVGPVGRGKSMLMDLFYSQAPVEKKMRTHFHVFMQEVHKKFHALEIQYPKGEDPIPKLAEEIVEKTWLLCFDEFQVNDIADAMILGRLFEYLFKLGVIIVATSNVHIRDLFQNRPGADAFKPFIALLSQNMIELELCSAHDYRLGRKEIETKWLIGCNPENHALLDKVFLQESGGKEGEKTILTVMGRQFIIPCAAGKVARFQFEQLCDAALGAGDYLVLAQKYEVLIIDNIPIFNPENMNVIERFTTLIDVLYERHTILYASAETDWEHIYPEENRAAFFERTVSRLYEMQSLDWTK